MEWECIIREVKNMLWMEKALPQRVYEQSDSARPMAKLLARFHNVNSGYALYPFTMPPTPRNEAEYRSFMPRLVKR